MKYDEALRQAEISLDDEFNTDFQVFDDAIAGEDKITIALQAWFNASGAKKVELADNLEFAIRNVRTFRTNRHVLEAATLLVIDSGTGKQDSDTGEWQ